METPTEAFEIIRTEKGKRKILFDGSSYVLKKKLAGDKELFECSKRRSEAGCYASIHLQDGKIVKVTNSHSHAPEAAKINVWQETLNTVRSH